MSAKPASVRCPPNLLLSNQRLMKDNVIRRRANVATFPRLPMPQPKKQRGNRLLQTWTQHCPLWPDWESTVDLSELPRNEPVIWIYTRWREGERSCKLSELKAPITKTIKTRAWTSGLAGKDKHRSNNTIILTSIAIHCQMYRSRVKVTSVCGSRPLIIINAQKWT